MGRSLVAVADLLDRQLSTPEANNPFTALGRRFFVDRQGKHVWHRQAVLQGGKPVLERAQQVHWAIGSGQKGYSYLTEQDGYLLQTPISWFTQKQRWDLSPGFGPSALAARVVPASCLFCHVNRVLEHPDHPDRFLPPIFAGQAIGCERCHGPGELHVTGDLDHTIVNPAKLSPSLRDAVCEQCHLEGEARVLRSGRKLFDYRPGLALHDFWAVLVKAGQSGADSAGARAVNHVEQMYQSKCFGRPVGGEKLGCTTCHDPHIHIGPQKRVAHYRAACLKCHHAQTSPPQPPSPLRGGGSTVAPRPPFSSQGRGPGGGGRVRGCSVPLAQRRQTSPQDSCIDCHMPRYTSSDIAHTASTDHRIVRRISQRPVSAGDLGRASFVDFYHDRFPEGDRQSERNLGMGLVKMLSAGMLKPQRNGARALFLLESARAQYPHDLELQQSKAVLLHLLRRPSEALPEAQAVLAQRPGNWRLLTQAATAAQAAGQTDRAIGYWRQAVRINPVVPEFQVSLLSLLLRAGKLDEARLRCRELLRLDPFNVSGRQAWIGFLLREGKKAEARAEFDLIRQLKPPDLAEREKWFEQQVR
jgi:Flp pilus assembly protein TadD